jgi:CubicO group peptidase (beta-lactamase class C family)
MKRRAILQAAILLGVGGVLGDASGGTSALPAPSTPPAQMHGELARAIHAELAARAEHGFGGAILIEQQGTVILDAGYGWANREMQLPFTTQTIAQIGSLTKQFTAAALLDLWSQGKVDLTAPVARYLAHVPPAAAGITLEQLLTHTSGLPESCGDDFEPLTREGLIETCLGRLERPPGSQFAYSNLGYSVLAAVVEQVSAQPLDDLLARRFFTPLGMRHTGYRFDATLHDSLAVGYGDSLPHPPISDRLQGLRGRDWNLRGNGGMQASVQDMYTWYRALAAGTALADSARQQIFAPHVWRDSTVAYGYGWFVRQGPHGECVQASHTGSDGTFFAAIVWRPVDRLFYDFVCNSGEAEGAVIASLVLRRCREMGAKSK